MPSTTHKATAIASQWPQDTIYSEAVCSPADEIFYEGSDDEYYESAEVRKQRYEAAGRRFLNGDAPFILTAGLIGPFEQSTGWTSPWGSGRQTKACPANRPRRSPTRPQIGKENRLPIASKGPQRSVEGYLPSPESLKQVSVEPHPFLGEAEVARVQDWRTSIDPKGSTDQDIQLTEESTLSSTSTRKRKFRDSEWLKRSKSTIKKRKITEGLPDPFQTPTNRRSRSALDSSNPAIFSPCARSSLTPSFADYSTPPGDWKRHHKGERGAGQLTHTLDNEDELVDTSSSSATRIAASQHKRLSPKKAIWKTQNPSRVDSEDELAQDRTAQSKKATAALTSPISLSRPCLKRNMRSPATAASIPPERLYGDASVKESSVEALTASKEGSDVEMCETTSILEKHQPAISELQDDEFGKQSTSALQNTYEDTTFTISHSIMARESSPLSSISSSFDSESWTGFSFSTKDDIFPGGGSEGAVVDGEDSELKISDSESTADSEPPASVFKQANEGPADAELKPVDSDDASDCSSMSELSEPSTMHSMDLEMQSLLAIEDEPSAGNDDDCASTSHEYVEEAAFFHTNEDTIIVSVEEPVQHLAGYPPRTEAVELTEANADDSTHNSRPSGAIQPLSPVQGQDNLATNIAGSEIMEGVEDVEHSADPDQEVVPSPLLRVQTPEPTPAGFSFRSVLQRLASTSTWKRSQHSAPEVDEAYDLNNSLVETSQSATSDSGVGETSPTCEEIDRLAPSAEIEALGEPSTTAISNSITSICSRSQSIQPAETGPLAGPACTDVLLSGPSTAKLESPPFLTSALSSEGQGGSAVADSPDVESSSSEGSVNEFQDAMETCDDDVRPSTPTQPSTPESCFQIKPFSAFMTPSPEHRARQSVRSIGGVSKVLRFPNSSHGLVPIIKNHSSSAKISKRVSWAPIPGEQNASEADGEAAVACETADTKRRPASPPPMAPVGDLPTSKDADFQGHFNAIAKRSVETPAQELLQESQLSDSSYPPSPKPKAQQDAEHTVTNSSFGAMFSDPCEPVAGGNDLTEQVFADLEDLLRPWDLDAELDQARKQSEEDGLGIF